MDAIWKHATFVKWKAGDILIIDNKNIYFVESPLKMSTFKMIKIIQ